MFKPADFEDTIRLVSAFAIAIAMAWRLHDHGWPWFQWLPAAILTFTVVTVLWVLIWYLRRKLTYRVIALRTKANLQAGGDGWSNNSSGRL